jgi:uracil-DNA glycosylase
VSQAVPDAGTDQPVPAGDRLLHADPAQWAVDAGWTEPLARFWASTTGRDLADFLRQRLDAGAVVYPPQPLRALALTAPDDVRVVILGQDPYHGPGQAEGLAFSVAPGVRIPPSLRNIHKEQQRDLKVPAPASGSLVGWARQGVLLLNTCLTVEDGLPASHAGRGWEALTDALIRFCVASGRPKAFLLWGAHAQKRASGIDPMRHLVLCANHPSPLSASRGPAPFLGCGHFGAVNRWLRAQGQPEIEWSATSGLTQR